MLQSDLEHINRLLRMVELLTDIRIGCEQHPSYKAFRPPRIHCVRCDEMYEKAVEYGLVVQQYNAYEEFVRQSQGE